MGRLTDCHIPTGYGTAEFTEKRSRFIGQVFPVGSEAEARARIDETKKKYHDARHNCWCYLLRGGVERYADDGEPQGTAGQPMLEVFRRAGVADLCCVVTRYFGGILLGAGGLLRAYTRSAADALDAAGISVLRRWVEAEFPCPYARFDQARLEVEACGGALGEITYGAEITLRVLLPEGRTGEFAARIAELTAGGAAVQMTGEVLRAVPVDKL